MSDKFSLLLVSLVAIIVSFFIGLYFGRSIEQSAQKKIESDLRVSLEVSTGAIRMQRSNPHIRVIVNGQTIEGSGSTKIAK